MAFLLDLVVGDWFNASSTWLSFTISGLGGSNRIPCSSCEIVGQTRTLAELTVPTPKRTDILN